MSETNKRDPETNDPLMDHIYDGIQELANPLPGWWLATFYITIGFAVVYLFYHMGYNGKMIANEYQANLAAHEAKIQKSETKLAATINNDVFIQKAADSSVVEAGKKVFTTSCASCHGGHGEGGIGPNLTDTAWINGEGKPMDIFKVVKDGTPAGMPAWGKMMGQEELVNVSAYIVSIKGSNPPNAKAAQGKVYE